MGGFVILISTIIPTLFWADLANYYNMVLLFRLLSFGGMASSMMFRSFAATAIKVFREG